MGGDIKSVLNLDTFQIGHISNLKYIETTYLHLFQIKFIIIYISSREVLMESHTRISVATG